MTIIISISIGGEGPMGFPVIRITADHKDNEAKGAFVKTRWRSGSWRGAIAVEKGGPTGAWGPRPTLWRHPHGGNRETNVVDRFGFSQVPNLGIVGGSVMGTSGAHNPT